MKSGFFGPPCKFKSLDHLLWSDSRCRQCCQVLDVLVSILCQLICIVLHLVSSNSKSCSVQNNVHGSTRSNHRHRPTLKMMLTMHLMQLTYASQTANTISIWVAYCVDSSRNLLSDLQIIKKSNSLQVKHKAS